MTSRYRKTFFLLLLTCTICYHSIAQRYPFYNLNVENGLIQSQASCLAQDKNGNLWIGTIGGLSRYDGRNFTNYSVRNGMLNNIVHTIAVDTKNHIWIGNANSVSSFDGKTFTHYVLHAPGNATADTVNELQTNNNDTIWCRTNRELYYICDGKVHYQNGPPEHTALTSMLPDGSGLWLANISGRLYHYQNGNWDAIEIDSTNGRRPIVLKIYKDHAGAIWLGTNIGLYKIEGKKASIYYVNHQPMNLPPILCMTEDNSNSLWIGIYSGALHITTTGVEYYNKKNGLTDNIISDVLTDKEGNIWLASDGQGVFRFSGAEFTILDERIGLPSAQVTAFAPHANGSLWVGTYDAGLFILENGKVSQMDFPSNPKPNITCMYTASDDKLWIGTRNMGLWEYGENFISYNSAAYHPPSNTVSCLYSDSPGRLWIGYANGFARYENHQFKSVFLNNLIVYNMLRIGKDSLLLATTSGIKLYNGSSVSTYITKTSLDSSSIQCMLIKGNELWAGTDDNGVIAYNMLTKTSKAFNKQNGFHSDFIYNMVADNDGNIWAGTGYGIHRISETINGQYIISFYGKEKGITGMESNLNAVLKLHDGSIWFGTTNGAVHYRPHAKTVTPKPVSIAMQSIKLFGQDISDNSYYDSTDKWYGVPYQLHLPHLKNNISFSFQGVMLGGGELYYRYIIEGIDATWSNWSLINSVTYSAIPPGNYIFHVQCKTANDDKTIQELKYPFEIITPFHKTGLFRLLILAGCILLGVSIQYIINKRKQNRIKLLNRLRSEEQAKIRLRTAEDFHDEVGNKLTRINVLTNVLQSKLGDVSADTKRILTQIQENAMQLYGGTRDILWSLQPANDNLYEIVHRIRDLGNELFQDTDVEFNFYGTDEAWKKYKLPMDVSRNLTMIFKEALNNCLKYSEAKHVKLEANVTAGHNVDIQLSDDGKGFSLPHVKKGHGIDNMNVRAGRLGGKLYIDSNTDKGTTIALRFHIKPLK